jgi:cell wall-associated NlpC family hydrolase
MSREAFVAAARGLIGAPWRHRGRKPWGIDCIGLLVLSARAAGRSLDDAQRYGRNPWEDRLRKEMRRQLGEPVVDPWYPGDVALIQWQKDLPTHVAIIGDYIHGGLSLIHCENLNGCVEHSLSGHYKDCVVEVYRLWPVKSSL